MSPAKTIYTLYIPNPSCIHPILESIFIPMSYSGKRLNIGDALQYLDQVKSQFQSSPTVYNTFLDIMKDFNTQRIDTPGVIERVSSLFRGHPLLVEGFNTFLPPGYSIECSLDPSDPHPVKVTTPSGTVSTGYREPVPVEMDDAIGYVNRIKVRFTSEPHVYKAFLDLLQTYRRELPPIQDVYRQVAVLFRGAPDLLADFKKFLPDDGVVAEPKPQVNEADLPPFGNFKAEPREFATSSVRDTPQPQKREFEDMFQQPVGLDDELAFFERAKKHMANKNTYTTFLRFLTLYSSGVLDKKQLVERVAGYLSPELLVWFKKFIGFQDTPHHIENIGEFKKHRLQLGLCKSYGPSYRQLPKLETYMPCLGRDEMCWEVLNDEWVGHPTWDSEESGYIAHRKNQYEDNLFRIEEERHEFDFYMENNMRTIQTLETIAHRIAVMSPEDRARFKLPDGLGHTSKTIYKKIIRKIYGPEKGFKVIDALHEAPAVAVPLVLKRLKQKDAEWRKLHRDWCRYWRDQELKMFYKLLDHLGLTFKQTDKKLLTTKQLVSEISTVKVDSGVGPHSKRLIPLAPKPKEQLEYQFEDRDVLLDISGLVMTWIQVSAYSSADKARLCEFFNSFVLLFYGFSAQETEKLAKLEFEEEEEPRKRHRDPDLLRDVLLRKKRAKKEEEKPVPVSVEPESWIDLVADNTVVHPDEGVQGSKRTMYNLFCNTTVYVFFRHIQVLYERLLELKQMDSEVEKEIGSRFDVPFAKDLDLVSHQLADMGLEIGWKDCYKQVVAMAHRLIEGEIEHQWYEELLRQAYRNKAFKLFTVDKVVQGLVKHMHNITSDHRTTEMILLFEKDRTSSSTTTRKQIVYRMRVRQLMNLDENMFRIEMDEHAQHVSVQFVALEDLTLKDKRTPEEQYNYYLTTYLMNHPTEGVPLEKINMPYVKSSLGLMGEQNVDGVADSKMRMRIDKDSYKLTFEAGLLDGFTRFSVGKEGEKARGEGGFEKVLEGEFGWKNGLEGEGEQKKWEAFVNRVV